MLLVVAVEAAAQQAPPHVLAFSPAVPPDVQALDAFSGKRSSTDGFRALERPGPWKLYGRLGLVHFQNQLAPDSGGMQFTWRRTGPGLGGRIYLGIHRRF